MKEYIKLFDTPVSANDYEILDIPFITTIESTDQNLHCNELAKKLVNNNGVVSVVDDAVTITGTWNPSATHNRKKAIISGEVTLTGKTDCYSLTFETGGHLTINAGARLRVWLGGIVNDDCNTVNYLTIVEDTVNDVYGEFLLHPDVTVNNHPLASVEFISNSYRKTDGSAMAWQRFGIPSFGALTEITATAPTAFARFNKETNEWESIGILGTMDLSKMANSFEWYDMLNNTPDTGTVVTMKGQLFGNGSPELFVRGNNYVNSFINSYTGVIKTSLLLSLLVEHNISSIRVGPNNTEINSSNVDQWPYIQPGYCTFIFGNSGAQFNLTISYKDLVWDPSFEEEVVSTRGLMKDNSQHKSELPDDPIFQDPEPIEFESLTLENNLK